MDERREAFFKMVDQTPVHPLVAWARDEIIRLEGELAKKTPVVIPSVPPGKTGGSQ